LLWINQEQDTTIKLTDLGFTIRPDLTDGHTIHFHGFRNAIPLFDGVPEMSIAVPIGRAFTYFYRPHDPGTYMWHCHFEDVEHVQMGMTGIIFVRPTMGPKFVYNHASTAFDREFAMFLSEWWAEAHFRGAHIQEHDWSEYNPDYWLLNGRVYPDTLEPNGGGTDATTGDLIPPAGRPNLKYQPISSLVRANAGDKVLLRFVDLGYQQHAMTLAGIPMKVVGKDATLLRNGSTDLSYNTDTIYLGPGESYDAIFTAPVFDNTAPIFTDSVGTYNKYLLYNRNYGYLHNPGVAGLGGQATEIRIYAGGVPAQTVPNT
jgi:FtsP/CotA-like multicopper oxidase with cupredoxin domain